MFEFGFYDNYVEINDVLDSILNILCGINDKDLPTDNL